MLNYLAVSAARWRSILIRLEKALFCVWSLLVYSYGDSGLER